MKTRFLAVVLLVVSIVGVSCLKTKQESPCTPIAASAELPAMQKYATDNGFNMTTDQNGLMTEVLQQGSGPAVTTESYIRMTYLGKNMNGVQFDAGTTQQFLSVKNFIIGFQIALLKLNEGGKIRVIIPSSLAYGCEQHPLRNQPLYFEVEVLEIMK